MVRSIAMTQGHAGKALKTYVPFALAGAIFIGLFAYGFWQMNLLTANLAATASSFASSTAEMRVALDKLEEKVVALSDAAYTSEQSIGAIKTRLGGFEQTVGTISGTVGTLQKLSKTDPELLQKYSKVFFLNEHYAPERLVEIDTTYLYSENRLEQIHALVWPHLKALLDVATSSNVTLFIKSAYRPFDEQTALKSTYSVTYGAGTANQFSADQGYSEHQLGTAIDFVTTGLGGALDGFEKTMAYEWLLANAHTYGYILSYPEGNTYYMFEPWHWRYVGVALATYIHNQNTHFYDLEQRIIDEYLVNIFD